jgi:glutamine amidotransferase
MSLLIVDYGMGNLRSVSRALEEVGADCLVSDDPRATREVAGIVLPGVGSFAEGMANLRRSGMADAITEAVRGENVPVLGICLGMQLLATIGHEGGETTGLDLIPGEVCLLPRLHGERIPHVGWNEVSFVRDDELTDGLADACDFYFVHSYAFAAENPYDVIATTPYACGFASMVGKGCVRGVQFHPERSSKPGFKLLGNFLSLCYT